MFPINSTRPQVTEFQNPSCLCCLLRASLLAGWWAVLPTAMSSLGVGGGGREGSFESRGLLLPTPQVRWRALRGAPPLRLIQASWEAGIRAQERAHRLPEMLSRLRGPGPPPTPRPAVQHLSLSPARQPRSTEPRGPGRKLLSLGLLPPFHLRHIDGHGTPALPAGQSLGVCAGLGFPPPARVSA